MIETMMVVVMVLILVSLSIYWMEKRFSKKVFKELKERVAFWWGMVFVFSLTLWVHPNISLITLGFLCFFALREFFSLIETTPKERKLFLWAYLAIPIHFYWIWSDWYGMFIIFIPVYVFLLIPVIRLFVLKKSEGFLKAVSSTHWGLMLMVFGLSHLAYYGIMQPQYGAQLVLYLVFLTQFADIIQFLVSKIIGKRPVIAEANAHVTWEGLLISFISTIGLGGLVAPLITPLSVGFGIVTGALISLAAFLGTLNISCVKQDLQTEKETFQPNESFLSRIDSLSYTAPLFLHFIRYFFDWI